MKTLLVLLVMLISLPSFADEASIKDKTLREISKDLADLYDEIQTASSTEGTGNRVIWKPHSLYLKTAKDEVAVRAGADRESETLSVAGKNQPMRVVGQANDWFAVEWEEPRKGITTGWVNASEGTIYQGDQNRVRSYQKTVEGTIESSKSTAESIYRAIQKRLLEMKEKYRNDPEVTVEGFSIDLKIPPGVSVQFKFR